MMKEVVARGIEGAFHTPNAIHPRYIDAEVASLVRQANFQTIRLGLETTSSHTQERTGAKVTNRDFVKAVACLEGAGLCRKDIDVYAMMGLPGQGAGEVRETLRFINDQGCTIRLVSYSPIPGTEEWKRAVAESELPLSSDPSLHNPSIYPVRNKAMSWEVFEDLKSLASELNARLRGRSRVA
jgi:radical SAM superfamily enzyme YgiQ (UPF0313 family)